MFIKSFMAAVVAINSGMQTDTVIRVANADLPRPEACSSGAEFSPNQFVAPTTNVWVEHDSLSENFDEIGNPPCAWDTHLPTMQKPNTKYVCTTRTEGLDLTRFPKEAKIMIIPDNQKNCQVVFTIG